MHVLYANNNRIFFSREWINHFPFISYGKNSFGIRLFWYKSRDLERIKVIYRGSTVVHFCFLDPHCSPFSNWGTESDPDFKGYHNGNSDPRGYGMYPLTTIVIKILASLRRNLICTEFVGKQHLKNLIIWISYIYIYPISNMVVVIKVSKNILELYFLSAATFSLYCGLTCLISFSMCID